MDGLIMRRGWLVAWRDVTTNAPLPKSRPGIISIPGFSNPWVYKALRSVPHSVEPYVHVGLVHKITMLCDLLGVVHLDN